jgi:hypothetical protein
MTVADGARGEADIAGAAALLADPTRARVLVALSDGRALPASVLAAEAGVTPQAARNWPACWTPACWRWSAPAATATTGSPRRRW